MAANRHQLPALLNVPGIQRLPRDLNRISASSYTVNVPEAKTQICGMTFDRHEDLKELAPSLSVIRLWRADQALTSLFETVTSAPRELGRASDP